MADEQHELRQINWTELFGFTQIFKSFKMAIHSSKLLLGVAAILSIYILGYAMSIIWGWFGANAMVLNEGSVGSPRFKTEIASYYTASNYESFAQRKSDYERDRLGQAAKLLEKALDNNKNYSDFKLRYLDAGPFKIAFSEVAKADTDVETKSDNALMDEAREDDLSPGDLVGRAEDAFSEEVEKIEDYIDEAFEKAAEKISKDETLNKEENADLRELAEEQLDQDLDAAKAALTRYKMDFCKLVTSIEGKKIFPALLDYELGCVKNAISAALSGNFLTGLCAHQDRVERKATPLAAGQIQEVGAYNPGGNQQPGFFAWLLRAGWGICWLVSENLVFAIIFLLGSLAILAVFGGAISRIAALEFCRQEKISIGQALSFSVSKSLSFFSAPLIPVGLSLVAGLLLAVGGALGSIPIVGEVLLPILVLLGLLFGLGTAFLLIGLIAGAGLMYPTIAVEGSDSFDSMGRTFSYIFGRPWHAAFYGLVAVIYGVITYAFVRFFVYLALLATHTAMSWGSGIFTSRPGVSVGASKIDQLWAQPTYSELFRGLNWDALSGWEVIWAFGVGAIVFLFAALAFAYLISYYFSASTAIYCLLRRQIDATDLDEAFTEEFDEQLDWAAEASEPAPTPAESAEEPDKKETQEETEAESDEEEKPSDD